LKEILLQPGKRTDLEPGVGADTRSEVARRAGLSKRQQVTAVRVANIPREEFDRMGDGPNPPSVTALAEMERSLRRSRSNA
jgi:hypothetical protein